MCISPRSPLGIELRELSMTLFVEIPDPDLRERMLVELRGLKETVGIDVDGTLFRVKSNPHGVFPDRTTAVHYFKVELSDDACCAIRSKNAKMFVRVDHPRYDVRVELPRAVVASLAEDFS